MEDWVDVGLRVGDVIGTNLLGAEAGETIVGDSTTVHLYKALAACRADRPGPIVVEPHEFPTDRYVAAGLGEVVPALVDGAAAVLRSVVDYRTGELQDVAAVSAAAHDAGALVVWDCSHAVGVVPLALRRDGADLAVDARTSTCRPDPARRRGSGSGASTTGGCTSRSTGWWGQTDRFSMDEPWSPLPGIGSWASGTPNVLGTVAVEAAVGVVVEAGIDGLRTKSMALTAFARDVADSLGLDLASPRDPARCGGHVAVRHPRGPHRPGPSGASGDPRPPPARPRAHRAGAADDTLHRRVGRPRRDGRRDRHRRVATLVDIRPAVT